MGHKLRNQTSQANRIRQTDRANSNTTAQPRTPQTPQLAYRHDVSTYQANPAIATTAIAAIPWLDEETKRYLRHVLALLIARRDDLLAAILYGSVARQTARPLDDPEPSDIDVLLIFAPEPGEQRVSNAQHTAVSWAKVEVIDRYEARELQMMATVPDFAGWDSSFVENVARDGILLWARRPLPAALRPVEERQQQHSNLLQRYQH